MNGCAWKTGFPRFSLSLASEQLFPSWRLCRESPRVTTTGRGMLLLFKNHLGLPAPLPPVPPGVRAQHQLRKEMPLLCAGESDDLPKELQDAAPVY